MAEGARPSPTPSASTVATLEGSVAIARQRRAAPDRPAARPAGQRPGALRRPGRGRLHRGLRALRRGRGDRHLPAPRRRDARPTPTTRPAAAARSSCCGPTAAGTVEGIAPAGPTTAPSSPVTDDDLAHAQITTRDIDRGDVPALPAQGDHASRPASFRKTLRGKLVERRRTGCRVGLGDESLPDRRARRARATAASTGSWSSARAPPRSPARAWPQHLGATSLAEHRPAGRGAARHRAVGLPAAPTTCPTPSSWRSASPAPPPTPTARSTWSAARGGVGDRHRQPAQQRPDRQGRRRALHLRRARRGDERRLHQGLLRPDRRRASCSPPPSPTRCPAGCAPTAERAGAARGRCATCPPPWSGTFALRADDRRGRPARFAPRRRYWAIVGNGAQPHRRRARSGSSSPSSATSRSPATPPRTRSTSTCRRSR